MYVKSVLYIAKNKPAVMYNDVELLDREYFHDYRDCVLDYVSDDLLDDDLYDEIGQQLEDVVFEMFLFSIKCGIATHLVETFLKKFKDQLNNE